MKWLALISVMIATPAAAADQFDLICTAKQTTQRYKIDLARGEWCNEDCKQVNKIAELTEGTISLFNDKPAPPRNATAWNRINRSTGEWHWFYSLPQFSVVRDIKGTCEPAPFSGFPAKKF